MLQHRTLMVQGTSSDAGKSAFAAGLCRLFMQLGYRVLPFKSWNMSLNSAVTPDGSEIGRAQAEQARACRIEPRAEMNPFLLKPKGAGMAQVIRLGKPYADMQPVDLATKHRAMAIATISQSLELLRAQADIIVIEGAGSPAEVNVRERDLSNMETALLAHSPVILVADASRRGGLAAAIGTWLLLAAQEQDLMRWVVFNRSDWSREEEAEVSRLVHEKTAMQCLGFLPQLGDLALPSEDSASFEAELARAGKQIVQKSGLSGQEVQDPADRLADAIVGHVGRDVLLQIAGLTELSGSDRQPAEGEDI